MQNTDPCPCGQAQLYKNCCGRFLETGAYPQDAEKLMRSRYTAYVLCNVAYLRKTWHPDTCPELSEEEIKGTQWLGLEVLNHKPGLKKAIVEFNAYFQGADGTQCLHEVSQFKKVKNRWVYLAAI
jgi:SEC-C motif-containing protein